MPVVSKRKRIVIMALVAIAAAIAGAVHFRGSQGEDVLKLYGSVDMRTTTLAFEEGSRIQSLLKHEGEPVAEDEFVGRLDDRHQRAVFEEASAQVGVAERELKLLLAGSRPEEIEEAKARLAAARAAYDSASSECRRQRKLGHATSAQAVETACAEANVTQAKCAEAKTALARILAGTRLEQVEVAKANLALAKARLGVARLSLENCVLKSPVAGTIRTRLKEPGDMVSAGTGVYEIALTDPLWARVWIDEANLGKVKMGAACEVTCDAYPAEKFQASVGFISSVAEFTPKAVQTEEVRTSLVYEVRLTLTDPTRKLRLGMPVTARVLP